MANGLLLWCGLASGLTLFGCSPAKQSANVYPPDEGRSCPALSGLFPEHAVSDAARSLRRGDRHLLGVYGYTVMVPGLAVRNSAPVIPSGFSVKVLEGSGDNSEACPHLGDRAMIYATRYNQAMVNPLTRLIAR
jgi:hypothetical protein